MSDDYSPPENNSAETPEEPIVDQTLECRDCGDLFLFTVAEQVHYNEKGLKHPPSRCPSCRKKNREAVQATMMPVQCRKCRKKGFVPEAQTEAVDVLCEQCFVEIKQRFGRPEQQPAASPPDGTSAASDGTLNTPANHPVPSADSV